MIKLRRSLRATPIGAEPVMGSGKLASRPSSRLVIYGAIAGDLLIAATKFAAAAITGSSAMLSEGVHSVVDTGNGILLLYGLHRAQVRPDREHPLGHGRELYFWSFVVAVLLFAFGAGVSLYEGLLHVMNPEPVQNPAVNYVVLGLSALFDGSSWWLALRSFKGEMRFGDLFAAVRASKDPPSFMVLFEDSAAIVGLIVAFAGVYLSVALNLPVLDGVGSILIGLVLAVTAALLAQETKSLLIGERADQGIVDALVHLAEQIPGIAHANGIMTVHLAPQQIVIALSLEFADELRTPEIESKVAELERRVCQLYPEVVALFVKPQSLAGFEEALGRRHHGIPDE
jgi:cation diffusion facilitator family transporter